MSNTSMAMGSIALALLKCHKLAARAVDEQQILQSVCDYLVSDGGLRGARVGSIGAGEHANAEVSYSLPLKAGGEDLGTLSLSCHDDGAAFEPEALDLLAELSEDVAKLILAVRRREQSCTANGPAQVDIDAVPALIWTTLPDGRMDYWNARHLQYTGMKLEDSLGWGWMKNIHPDDLEQLMVKWYTGLLAGVADQAEARWRRADGVYRWHLFRAVPLHDDHGNITKWYGATTDIDDLKRTEAALRRSESFLAKAQPDWELRLEPCQWRDPLVRRDLSNFCLRPCEHDADLGARPPTHSSGRYRPHS
jgi:PAS domain S-box-containing protein